MEPGYSGVANGDIAPARFVKIDTSYAGIRYIAAQAATDQLVGVSGLGHRFAPYSPIDDGLAAKAGENIPVLGPPRKNVALELGGSVTVGDMLTSTTAGKGITTTTDHHVVGAIAQDTGVLGDIIPVQLVRFEISA